MKKRNHKVPKDVKGVGYFTPMDIAPGEYGETDFTALKKIMLDALEKNWGPRCKTKDYEDFPEFDPVNAVGDPDIGRCPACLVYEKFDKFWEYFAPDDMEVS